MRDWRLVTVAVVAALVAGCGSSRRLECDRGESRDCECAPGVEGTQVCDLDDHLWNDCECEGWDGDGDADVDSDVDADSDSDVDSDVDADSDSDADYDVDVDWDVEPPPVTKVDILFVVDNSNSMSEEQAELNDQFWPLVEELLEPTVDPATGEVPPAVTDLHVGVISSDMGTLGHTITTCDDSVGGDAGVMQNAGRRPGCDDSYSALDCAGGECPWLSHSTEIPDDGTDESNAPIWDDFPCISTLGTGGCGFEQPLESSLAALTTQAEPGMPNHGFVRDDSLIAVIYVTDEDDCSTGDPAMFDPSRDDLGPLNLRCFAHEELLHPVARYFAGFVGLREYVGHLVVAAIAGIPDDESWIFGDPLDDLRAMRVVNPEDTNSLLPSCDTDMGLAFPPARIVELAYMFRDYGYVASICYKDWTVAQRDIARMIQRRLPPPD